MNVSKLLGIHITNVYRFTYPKEKGGRGGLVPTEHIQSLLSWARANNVDLTADDFFESDGAETAEAGQ